MHAQYTAMLLTVDFVSQNALYTCRRCANHVAMVSVAAYLCVPSIRLTLLHCRGISCSAALTNALAFTMLHANIGISLNILGRRWNYAQVDS